jgi:hypothetical protein
MFYRRNKRRFVHTSKKGIKEGESIRLEEHFGSIFRLSQHLSRGEDGEGLLKMFHMSQLLRGLIMDRFRKELHT